MKKLLAFVLVAVTSSVFAQSLQENLSAIAEAQNQNVAAEQRRIYEQQAAQKAAQDKWNAQQAAASRAAAQRQAAINAEQARKRNRQEGYEDAHRNLELEERRAQVAMQQAKAKRANDYVDADLKRENARTDVVQSKADSTRAVATGQRDMMSGIGKGEGQKNRGVFGN